MKTMLALIVLVFGSVSFAEVVSKERLNVIAQSADVFKKDCAAFLPANKVQIGKIKNLTSDHMDPQVFAKILGRELKIKNNKKAPKASQLEAVLRSSVVEQDQKRTTTYTLQLMLKKENQELCQQQYVSQFVDKLGAVN